MILISRIYELSSFLRQTALNVYNTINIVFSTTLKIYNIYNTPSTRVLCAPRFIFETSSRIEYFENRHSKNVATENVQLKRE